ncbi:hypothetical protein LTR15_000163 [Elasticomyces elasticus]|nr:hypothetical protein LTR15_000163 [Elasticomyces elasticus]
MALPTTTPTTDVPSATPIATALPHILNLSPELHAKILEYLLIFPHSITNLSTKPHASAALRALHNIGFSRINIAILFVNHSLHTAAMDVLYRNNSITLDVATHCSLHAHAASSDSAVDKSYHRLQLQILDAREQCDGFCVAKLLKRIVVSMIGRQQRRIIVELSGVHYTKFAGVATALAG